MHTGFMEILWLYSHFANTSLFGWLGFSSSFGKDSDDEVSTEQLTAVVDAWVDDTFMPHDYLEISQYHIRWNIGEE